MVTAVVDVIHIGLLELGYQRGEVLVAGGDAFKHGDFNASVLQGVTNGSGNTFTVLLLVVNDSNALRALGGDVAGRNRSLHAVQTDGTEYQLIATLGDLRAGGSRGYHQDAFILVDVRGGLGGAGAQVADHEAHAVVDQAVGNGHGLLRVTHVVVFYGNQLFTHHAAVGVDLLNRHAGAGELHVTILGNRAGHGAGNTDLDLGSGVASAHQGYGSANSGYEFFY